MNIVPVGPANLHLLQDFIAAMGSSAATFRYFRSRTMAALANHVVTLLGLDSGGAPVCYGHLDREGDTVWLGVCVVEGQTGRGRGAAMLRALLSEGEQRGIAAITLSVDVGNRGAIRLYEGFGFTLLRRDGTTAFYQRRRQGA